MIGTSLRKGCCDKGKSRPGIKRSHRWHAPRAVVKLRLAGSNKHPRITGLEELLGKSNLTRANRSLTKQFTAAAILALQERGTLNVQDSICRYLPQCPGDWEQITIHQLLTHTSGLPDASYLDKVELQLTANKAIAHLRDKPLRFTPGARFSYGSTNYVLLGYIIEKVSGRSYEAFLRENIIGPLGLTNTGYDHKESALKYRAAGYSLRGETLLNASDVEMSMPFAAGGLYSTAEDLHRWLKALVAGKLLPLRGKV